MTKKLLGTQRRRWKSRHVDSSDLLPIVVNCGGNGSNQPKLIYSASAQLAVGGSWRATPKGLEQRWAAGRSVTASSRRQDTHAGRPRDAAARRPDHHRRQNRSADLAFCLATEHLVAVRARRPRLHGQAPRPTHRLEARSPHPSVPQSSSRQRRQSGHKNAPSRRKNAISCQAFRQDL